VTMQATIVCDNASHDRVWQCKPRSCVTMQATIMRDNASHNYVWQYKPGLGVTMQASIGARASESVSDQRSTSLISVARGWRGHNPLNISSKTCRFVLRNAVSQTKYCCSLKFKKFAHTPKLWAGYATASLSVVSGHRQTIRVGAFSQLAVWIIGASDSSLLFLVFCFSNSQ